MTADTAHTPGPWKAGQPAWFRGRRDERDGKIPITSGSYVVANAYGIANARLMAAAPDLLEALRSAVEWMAADGCDCGQGDPPCALCAGRAAIRAASGGAA